MVIAFGLGSNLWNRLANLREAAARLESALGPLVGKSDVFETEPWGVRDQPWYLNACVSLEPERKIAPLELLSLVKGMERSLGRVEGERWRARKIDIDILLMGGTTFHSLELEIPHVRLDEHIPGLPRGQALVLKAHVQARVRQPPGERPGTLGLEALAAVHVPRQPAQDPVGFVPLAQCQHALGVLLVALCDDGLHGLRRQVQRVGHGHADALFADVEAQYPHAHTTFMQNWGHARAQ